MSTEESLKAFEKCKVVLVDIAGTTTSLKYIKETLFAFVNENIESFLKDNWEKEDVKEALKHLNDQKEIADVDAAVKIVKEAIEKQSDNIGLKDINGLVYKQGYESGSLKPHVYPDVPLAFTAWSKDRKIAIFSTGSVDSQKLLFKHSVEGDLTSNVTHYFDQSIGLKTVSETYSKIVQELNVAADEVLWISDLKEELTAAKQAGLLTVLIKRESEQEPEEFLKITTFTELFAETFTNKRKNEDDEKALEDAPPAKLSKKEIPEVDKVVGEIAVDSNKDVVTTTEVNGDSKTPLNGLPDIEKSELTKEVEMTEPEKETASNEVEVTKDDKAAEPEEEKISTEMEVDSTETITDNLEIKESVVSESNEAIPEAMETDNIEKTDVKGTVEETNDNEAESKQVEIENKIEEVKKLDEISEKKTDECVNGDIADQKTADAKGDNITNCVNETPKISEEQEAESNEKTGDIENNKKVDTVECGDVKPDAVDSTVVATTENDMPLPVENKDDTTPLVKEDVLITSNTKVTDKSNTNSTSEVLIEVEVLKSVDDKKADVDSVQKSDATAAVEVQNVEISETVTSPLNDITNKSDVLEESKPLANGKEITEESEITNGANDCEIDNLKPILNGQENGDNKSTENEVPDDIKVKKVESNADSSTVSIEA